MNGIKYFLDTNAIISLLNGNTALEQQLHSATWIGTSVICIIEFLSYPYLTASDRSLLHILSQRISILSIESSFLELELIAKLRQQTKLKLPDAVIAATAIQNQAVLLTNDRHFSSINNLNVVSY